MPECSEETVRAKFREENIVVQEGFGQGEMCQENRMTPVLWSAGFGMNTAHGDIPSTFYSKMYISRVKMNNIKKIKNEIYDFEMTMLYIDISLKHICLMTKRQIRTLKEIS